ncbi:MAG: hypothetical protein WCL03_11320 [Bacteroidota bacterium]
MRLLLIKGEGCTMYDVRCTMYDVRCTMYEVRFSPFHHFTISPFNV